ncbi:MAG TPA: arsenic transporter [Rhodopila sp.]|uniref:arsenic transporter n=1 Tax=Rhodopila sp. TaxID=2480087 RepID=UPI002C5E8EB1|nr:arsenic transporter [Rhodopila sp.]HVY14417.1 arsenic transporter [Rhodopila sp.]
MGSGLAWGTPSVWHGVTWGVAALATAGVIVRPWRLPEYAWAIAGAVILVLARLLPPFDAWQGIRKGTDVYLFLVGMMLLAEIARQEGLFDWLAAHAASHARGSATRLFALVYMVGTLVTVFLSNDATAVVLTPAVAAVARTAKAANPLPYLLTCAFIANAASFVLPISNPANLVIYGSHMPPLLDWLPRYALPSLASILATYGTLWLTQRRALRQPVAAVAEAPVLSTGGRVAGAGIVLTALVLMAASALDWQLGLPTCIAGVLTAAIVLVSARQSPWPVLKDISWGVLPLVAGLFVLVEALDKTGVIGLVAGWLRQAETWSLTGATWSVGVLLGLVCNLMNNLPAGLIASTAVQTAQASPGVTGAVLLGIDIGPNLSVTGSLATILWLNALRRDGLHVGARDFLRIGALVMPVSLLAALAALSLEGVR